MKDLFSGHATDYALYRPTYPDALYKWVLGYVQNFERAWDCGTGNGQVANILAQHFCRVEATDISEAQMKQASPLPNVRYHVCSAETTPFETASFDLITVGQALHWFDFERFNAEVKRVAKPHAIIAVWTYKLLQVSPEIDVIIENFYRNTLGEYWEKERQHVENQYADVPFPYRNVAKKIFPQTYDWTLSQLCHYLRTWSSVKKFERIHQTDPVLDLKQQLSAIWEEQTPRRVTFPVFVQLGEV
jgi:ubiquinone/menaquinone biosynthesis C-methylase UbiE